MSALAVVFRWFRSHPEQRAAEQPGVEGTSSPAIKLPSLRVAALLALALALPALAATPPAPSARPAPPELHPSAAPPLPGPPDTVEPLSASLTATPEKVKLGEPFTYKVVLTHKPDQRYELTRTSDLGDFELITQTRHRDDHAGTSTTTFELKMALFALGSHPLPDLTFEVTDGAGTHRYVTHGGSVEGISTLPPEAAKQGAGLEDIKPNEVVPIASYRLLWGLLGLIALGAFAYAGYRMYRRLRARALIPPPIPPRPLHERTLSALDALKSESLPAQGRAREFYFRLSEILRGYLGERFRFEALECTSSELLVRVRHLPSPNFPVGDFSTFVHDSDLVKFAKSEPTPETCATALDFAYRLVHQTHPPAVIPANALGPDVPQS